ncbi:MAG TPA: cysteine dioxygenase family protein, partial [Vicinamibacteria bacterium]|nr:cysteine dioxygenase family protein [Vicinamibacteria bacterium]
MLAIDAFTEGLCRIPEKEFTEEGVEAYLREQRVDPASLAPYLHYASTHYTRNLIYRGPLFELMTICWDVGQVSRIHNHAGQRCWMAVPIGRLVVQNYELVRMDAATGACEITEADRVVMDPAHPARVRDERPIHAVLNPLEYAERATSLHVYSRPYDRCLVYDKERKTYGEVPLFFDSEYGKPVS